MPEPTAEQLADWCANSNSPAISIGGRIREGTPPAHIPVDGYGFTASISGAVEPYGEAEFYVTEILAGLAADEMYDPKFLIADSVLLAERLADHLHDLDVYFKPAPRAPGVAGQIAIGHKAWLQIKSRGTL